jgi:hypothetical protein
MKTPDRSSGHISRAKDPKIVEESQSIRRPIGNAFWVLALIVFALMWVGWASSKRAEKKAADERAAANPPAQTTPQQAVEALVLEHECYTPCSANINWKFKIIWGDNPLRIIYPGGQVVDRRGKDEDFQAPSNMQAGETKFESLDPNNLHFRVLVYRVTYR